MLCSFLFLCILTIYGGRVLYVYLYTLIAEQTLYISNNLKPAWTNVASAEKRLSSFCLLAKVFVNLNVFTVRWMSLNLLLT